LLISSEKCGIFVVISSQSAELYVLSEAVLHVGAGAMRYLFGDYALDTRCCELRRTGRLIKLRPKVFDVLTYLIAHRDRVISRQELLEHLWPQQFVGEATLSSCIMEARQAVGDTGQVQRLIQTLHSRGYRFVAAVAEASESPPEEARRSLLAPLRAAALEDPGQVVVHTSGSRRDTHAATESSDISPEVLEGERKQVTLLCCALADARGLSVHLGPEAMYRLMRAFLALAQRVVQRYEGTLTQRLSDGFVAFFGATVAQEDHARRAMLAALELQQRVRAESALRELCRSASLSTSMGLHTGMVIVGPLGEEASTLYAALDATTDLASRLQRLAGPDTILLSEATRRLVQEEVRVEACDPLDLAEFPHPMPVYTVREVLVRRTGVAGRGGRSLSPFVGRRRELATLRALLARVAAGQGQVVGIVGEPGIGKSRLLYELAQRLRATGVSYLEAHCFAYEQATPYGPVHDILRQLCGMTDMDGPEALTTRLRHCLQEVGLTPEADVPYLLPLLGLPEGTVSLAGISPEVRKARTLALLRHLSLHSRHGQPRVIAVENVHWSDPTSEEYLARLVDSLSGAKLLLVTTYRPGHSPPWLDKSYATQLALPRLMPVDSRAVVRAVLSATPNAGRWKQAIAELPEDVGQRGLTSLQAAEFLYETHPFPDIEYTFKHALTHQVAYSSLLQERRCTFHARIVDALEGLYTDCLAEQIERLAHHAWLGEVWEKAVAYLRWAGAKAIAGSANREAVAHFERALVALQHLPESRTTLEQAIDVRCELRTALLPLNERGRILGTLREAEALAQALDDQRRLGRVSVLITHYWWTMSDLDHALASGHRVLDLAITLGDVSLQVMAYFVLGEVYYGLGNYPQAIAVLQRNVEALDHAGSQQRLSEPALGPGLQAVASRRWLIQTLADVGMFAEGLAIAEDTLRLAEADGHPYTLVLAYTGVGYLYLGKGEVHQAIPLLDRGLELCRVWSLEQLHGRVDGSLGYALTLSGRMPEALALLEQTGGQTPFASLAPRTALYASWVSEVYLRAGHLADAHTLAMQALALAREHQERGTEAWTLRLLGDIAMHHDPPQAELAENHYQLALTLADELGMHPLQAHCHLSLGTLYRQLGRVGYARVELSTAIELYRAMEMAFWLPQAEAALVQVQVR
jgi:class 3 adenylate cyclase/tetratricopeptide (TPR) repeat protein